MDEYAFHLKVWRILHALCSRWIRRKFNMRFEPLRVEGPVLLVPNHVNAWDPLLVAMQSFCRASSQSLPFFAVGWSQSRTRLKRLSSSSSSPLPGSKSVA